MANNAAFDYNKIPSAPAAQNSTFIVAPPTQIAPISVGPRSMPITCPSCKLPIITRISHNATSKTHLTALCLCLFFCWLCCCIPYCMDSCQNSNHYCPNCDAFIGTYQS